MGVVDQFVCPLSRINRWFVAVLTLLAASCTAESPADLRPEVGTPQDTAVFEISEVIRFSQSPTGGSSANPAWDFQFLIPEVEFGQTYSFRAHVVYKPFEGTQDLRDEYRNWRQSLEE